MVYLHYTAMALEAIGTITVGAMALRVHEDELRERKIDDEVRAEMRREQVIGRLGIGAIAAGFVLEMIAFNQV